MCFWLKIISRMTVMMRLWILFTVAVLIALSCRKEVLSVRVKTAVPEAPRPTVARSTSSLATNKATHSSKVSVSPNPNNDSPTLLRGSPFFPQQMPAMIAEQRVVYPGDYIEHGRYGVGQYLGMIQVQSINALVVKYKDAEVTWFENRAKNELFFYQSADYFKGEMSSLINVKKRKKQLDKFVQKASE